MEKYKFADLIVEMDILYSRLKQQSLPYQIKTSLPADIVIPLGNDFYERKQKENPHLTISDIEYLYAGFYFYNKLLDYDGFLLHSSAIAKDNQAYLFSADSGVGKSTHTMNWIKYFQEENVHYINDDKPAIRKMKGTFYCCGTPFSGKNDLSKNEIIPIRAIIFIQRGQENTMKRISAKEAIGRFLKQTIYRLSEIKMNKLLDLMNDLLLSIPIYELTCNMDVQSAKVAYEFIENDLK